MKPGDRIGKYILETKIGEGGMAEVWAGRVEGPGDFVKPVALKFVLPAYSNDREYGRLFFNEAKLAAEIQHANLVSIFDFDQIPADAAPGIAGRYFIAMERVEGRNLAETWNTAATRDRPFPWELSVHIVCEVLIGLRYIHERERLTRRGALVHRDVSPQNVLLSFAGEVKVSDFGIAKAESAQTSAINLRGKLGYLAPELLSGRGATHQADQFSAGIILWELLSGRRLFVGKHDAEVLERIRDCVIPAPRPYERELPPDLDRHVMRMLARNREDRFPSTAAALDALQPFVRGGGALRLSELMFLLFEAGPAAPVTLPRTAAIPRQTEAISPRSVTRLMPRPLSSIPRRRTARSRDPTFSTEIEHRRREAAHERYRDAIASGKFSGSIDDWFRHHLETGWDVFTETKLPAHVAVVIAWPRLAGVGWRVPLLPAWNGTYPWGSDGCWVVEDPDSDEMMALFPEALDHQDFRGITREDWRQWWLDREVDPDTELPGAAKLPVSERARLLVPAGSRPPMTSEEWRRLLHIEQNREDRETLRRMKRIHVLADPVNTSSVSWWKRFTRISSTAGHVPKRPK